MITATTTMEFICGHRLQKHEHKCRRPHGHNYKAEITVGADELDTVGRVLDFDHVEDALRPLLAVWDHRMLLEQGDPLIEVLTTFDQDCVVVLPHSPSAENIAAEIASFLSDIGADHPGVRLLRVRVFETPHCFADWTP